MNIQIIWRLQNTFFVFSIDVGANTNILDGSIASTMITTLTSCPLALGCTHNYVNLQRLHKQDL